MAQPITINSLMTKAPVTVAPETPLVEAANILSKYGFNGLPVVSPDGTLVGILTDHDLLTKGSAIYLPTFLKLMEGFEMYGNDALAVSGEVKEILRMKVRDVMNPEPLVLQANAAVKEGLRAFAEHHRVNPIPVVDSEGKLKGVLSRHDVLKLFGASRVMVSERATERSLDQNVDMFLADFRKEFLFVSKTRTHWWLFFSMLFVIVGFLIAFAFTFQFGPGR